MFSTLEINISIDDELAALLADYAAFIGESGEFAVETPVVDLPDTTLEPAVASDPGLVVDPMASADTVVFTGDTAPVVVDTGVTGDPEPVPTTDLPPADALTDALSDATVAPDLEGLVLAEDYAFDLDATILEVGRAFGQFGFTDLP